MVVNKLPEEVKNFVEQFLNLRIGNEKVRTPYYRNVKRVRAELRSLVGKGSPEEIEAETLIYAKLRGFSFKDNPADEIREFMQSQGIGIDCSGLVAHIYDKWLRLNGRGSVYSNLKLPKTNLYRSFIRWLRPIENVSADLLTNTDNSEQVSLRDVCVGDAIRLKGLQRGHHVAVIIKVDRDDTGSPKKLTYVHSSLHYGKENGVRIGEVEITDVNAELKEQKWLEVDENGVCWTLKQLEKDYGDNGLRRLRFFRRA